MNLNRCRCRTEQSAVADGTAQAVAARKAAGEPHPFVTGNAPFREWVGVLRSCAGTFLAQPPKP
jgi:hypothetical protein